jgi:uncharacterized membrane protein
MVLSLPQPRHADGASLWALRAHFFAYAISFLQLTVLWITHHHFFNLVHHIDRKVLWLNSLMLFALSLLPYATQFVGEHSTSVTAALFYGIVFLAFSLIFSALLLLLVRGDYVDHQHRAIIVDKRRFIADYFVKLLGFIFVWIFPAAILVSALIDSLIWLLPDQRAEEYVE